MITKTITYKDFNGDEVSEDFYFHLSQADLVELEVRHDGGLEAWLKRIVDAKDNATLYEEFKNIVLSAYGKRSEDGRRFSKSEVIREEFKSTGAYSQLIMELVTDTDAAVKFVNGIVPADMTAETAKLANIDPTKTPIIAVVTEPEIITKAQIEAMNTEELEKLGVRLAAGEAKLSE